MKRLILVAALLLAGCSDPPESGVVIRKEHHAAYSWVQMVCYAYDPKTSVCTLWMPHTHHVPERWSLCLRAGDEEGCRDVDQRTYDEFQVGEYYAGARS
jgi:hypothetical protein